APFFSLLRPHPRPPLSPYTTLFRSPPPAQNYKNTPGSCDNAAPGDFAVNMLFGVCRFTLYRYFCGCRPAAINDEFDAASVTKSKDRKSTRLNSSHVSISYAVFRLKQ